MFGLLDCSFTVHHYTIKDIIDDIDHYKFNKDGIVDARFIELALCKAPLPPVIIQHGGLKEQIYHGQGLIRSIYYYIVQNKPLEGLCSLSEYNGLHFSELPKDIQKYIKEKTYITTIYDDSYFHSNEIAITYCQVVENLIK